MTRCPCGAPSGWWAEQPAGGSWQVRWDAEHPGPWCHTCACTVAFRSKKAVQLPLVNV